MVNFICLVRVWNAHSKVPKFQNLKLRKSESSNLNIMYNKSKKNVLDKEANDTLKKMLVSKDFGNSMMNYIYHTV